MQHSLLTRANGQEIIQCSQTLEAFVGSTATSAEHPTPQTLGVRPLTYKALSGG